MATTAHNASDLSYRRLNALTGEWVVVSPHRTERPWQGQVDAVTIRHEPGYDPSCYLCPGNSRAGGHRNPAYTGTFVFNNDYPALRQEAGQDEISNSPLLIGRVERGICRVGCFSPRHDLTLAGMTQVELAAMMEMFAWQFSDLGSRDFINYVQIFENRGAMMGASSSHPHCQVWGTSSIPNEPSKEQDRQSMHMSEHGKCLLCEYLRVEQSLAERVVFQNGGFIVLIPYWAVWPFETLVLPVAHKADISELSGEERQQLGEVLQQITACYDKVFNSPFPYSMGFHQQPTDGQAHPEWHMHAHFFPPLLRSAGIRKFMVGFELLGSPQRDITPEAAAERLRQLL